MRLLELRLVEDPTSVVRFPAGFTVVAGLPTHARSWLGGALSAVVNGDQCGAAVLVDLDGRPVEIDPKNPSVPFVTSRVDPLLVPASFAAAVASVKPKTSEPLMVLVTDDIVTRARDRWSKALAAVDGMQRNADDSRAEQQHLLAARVEINEGIATGRQRMDPFATAVLDRAIESAARLEVETGALPGVCRSESLEHAKNRIVRLESAQFELESALAALAPIDVTSVDQALDVVRHLKATGPIELPEAVRLADQYRSTRNHIAALEERVASAEGGMASVNDRLELARQRYRAAEAKMAPMVTHDDDIAALEKAHDAVLEAERKMSGLFGGRSKKQLDEALTEERAILDRLGYPTWSAFIMGARMLDSTTENKRMAEVARRDLEEAEGAWARVMAKLGELPEFTAYIERLERLQEAALGIVGDVDDVERALRDLRVDPQPQAVTDTQARTNLANRLSERGVGVRSDLTLDDLIAKAHQWRDDVRDQMVLREQLQSDLDHCSSELSEARYALEQIQIVGEVGAIEGFGADRLSGARDDLQRCTDRLWNHRSALIRVAQLVVESERLAELEPRLAADLRDRERSLAKALAAADHSAENVSLLEAALATDMPIDPKGFDDDLNLGETDNDDPRTLGEALEQVLEARVDTLRSAGSQGAVPLILDDAFHDLGPAERCELLGWLEGYSLFLQIIYFASDPDVIEWGQGRSTSRTQVVYGEGYFV